MRGPRQVGGIRSARNGNHQRRKFTKTRQEFVRITDEVAAVVKKSGIAEGMVLVSAMHITSGVYVNDWEDGLIEDFQVWLERLGDDRARRLADGVRAALADVHAAVDDFPAMLALAERTIEELEVAAPGDAEATHRHVNLRSDHQG